MPFGRAIYGATIVGFTNAPSCVITVLTNQFLQVGSQVIVANVVNSGRSLNGKYTITNVSGNLITINQDTTTFGPYISGGFLTLEAQPNPVTSLQAGLLPLTIPWVVFNQARGGGTVPLT